MPEKIETVNGNLAPEQKETTVQLQSNVPEPQVEPSLEKEVQPEVVSQSEPVPQKVESKCQTEMFLQAERIEAVEPEVAEQYTESVELSKSEELTEENKPEIVGASEKQEALNVELKVNGQNAALTTEPSENHVDPKSAALLEDGLEPQLYKQTLQVEPSTETEKSNGETMVQPCVTIESLEPSEASPSEPQIPPQIINSHTNGELVLECRKPSAPAEPKPAASITEVHEAQRAQEKPGLIGTIANELKTEDYRLPDVVEVKKHFENVEPVVQNGVTPPPKKGALITNLDSQSIKQAYEDVRSDGSETQWAVFKFEGPKIICSATGLDFTKFRNEFGEADRAFGYIRVQTGDEMSKRQKFLLVTWVGPSVSVLKRAKMSTDKSLIKSIISNFAVELQTENIAEVELKNFVNELEKAGGAHYGTGIRDS